MKKKLLNSITFYPTFPLSDRQAFKDLAALVDNGTTVITIATPKGWKCKRKGCKTEVLHSHSTYPSISI